MGVSHGRLGGESVYHVAKRADPCHRGSLQAIIGEITLIRRLEHGDALIRRHGGQSVDRRVPDPTGGHIHDPLERLVVIHVDNKLQVSHHVLHLSPLEE